ncbi:MAG TPA: 2-hydroxychromene-2-carboxylate isomerase [Kofleriaceae bacterium]|nr:2-hydroxychromene-2-carboxylate isomerase [Kofleriaceae bacterium]
MLELWFDFSCPYAYLASRRAKHLGAEIDWRPMLLGGVFRGIGAGDGPMTTISPQKQAHNYHDMHRWADLFGEPFRVPAAHPMRTVQALRTLLALPRAWWPAAIEAIFAAYWQQGADVSNSEIVAQALRGAGVPEDVVATAISRADEPAIKEDLRQRTDEAISLGIFGAPAWISRRGDEALLIWGQDRMPWVEAVLAGWRLSGPPPGGPRRLGQAPGQAGTTLRPAVPGKTLDVYFDVSSPFAYLGLTQLPALAATGIAPRLVPILLGALFRDIGQANVPWFAMPAPKQRYFGLEMQRWASWWGQPFEQPRKFPQRTIAAQRLCILAAAEGWETGLGVAIALARGLWAEQRDLEDEATLRAILEAAEVPADRAGAWLAGTQDPAIKAQLAANTTAAVQAGVFGVPTFVVDGKHLFWGQDRLELVARALAGWDPP